MLEDKNLLQTGRLQQQQTMFDELTDKQLATTMKNNLQSSAVATFSVEKDEKPCLMQSAALCLKPFTEIHNSSASRNKNGLSSVSQRNSVNSKHMLSIDAVKSFNQAG
jgi:hypothetical protein